MPVCRSVTLLLGTLFRHADADLKSALSDTVANAEGAMLQGLASQLAAGSSVAASTSALNVLWGSLSVGKSIDLHASCVMVAAHQLLLHSA